MPVVPVDPTGQDIGTCGQHYPSGGGIIIDGTATGNTINQIQFSFGFVSVEDAIEMASAQMTEFNVNGDDIVAIDMFSEILMYNYSNIDNGLDALLNDAQSYMEQTVRYALDKGTISIANSTNGFAPSLQKYVNTLNKRGLTNVTAVNYYQQFEIEMKKAHLFHLLGKHDLATQILINTENCGVREYEQSRINYWKKAFQEEKGKVDYGFEAEFVDTNWVDTSTYLQPHPQQQFGNFGSFIQSPTSVLASSCGNNKSLNSDVVVQNKLEIVVYPNPANDELCVINNLNEAGAGKLVIHSLLGQQVLSLDLKEGKNTVDVSTFSVGSYIYSYFVDGLLEDTGKLVIQ